MRARPGHPPLLRQPHPGPRDLLGFEAEVAFDQGMGELAEWGGRQTVAERGDEALLMLRKRGLVGLSDPRADCLSHRICDGWAGSAARSEHP